MRVLWTHNFNPKKQNAGCFMYDVVPALRQLGIDVQFEYLGNLRRPGEMFSAARRVRQIAGQYDIIHAQYGSACAFVTSFVRNRPVVVSVRGNDWNTHDQSLSFAYFHTRAAKMMTLAALPSMQGVVSVSRRMHQSLQPYLRAQKVLLQPSPIDLRKWVPAPEAEGASTDRRTRHKVLFVALKPTDPIKRFDIVKRVVQRANEKLGNVELSIATGIPFAEMPRFVAQHHAMLCLSESEGWPNSVKEALACNIPFVASDVSDLRDIAAQERTCRVCRVDVEELATNLCEILSLPRSRDLRRFVAWMGIEESARRLRDFYAELHATHAFQARGANGLL